MSIRSIKSGEIDTFEIGHFYGWGYPWTRTFRQGRFSIHNTSNESSVIYKFKSDKLKVVPQDPGRIYSIVDEQFIGNGEYMIQLRQSA